MHTHQPGFFQRDTRSFRAQHASARLTTDMLIVQGRRLSRGPEGFIVSRNVSCQEAESFLPFIGAGSRSDCRARRHSISCTPRHSGFVITTATV